MVDRCAPSDSVAFQSACLEIEGSPFRALDALEEFSQAGLAAITDFSLPAERGALMMKQLLTWLGKPRVICTNDKAGRKPSAPTKQISVFPTLLAPCPSTAKLRHGPFASYPHTDLRPPDRADQHIGRTPRCQSPLFRGI